jgi:hypothetical protein
VVLHIRLHHLIGGGGGETLALRRGLWQTSILTIKLSTH